MHTNLIKYAVDTKKELVHIDDVLRGRACNCFCPSCGQPLIARKGLKNEHSFAHESGSECPHAYETVLHLLAKEVLLEGCRLTLPPLNMSKENEYKREFQTDYFIRDKLTIQPDYVQAEEQLYDFIPDLLVGYKNRKLIVEIYVTHKVDEEKLLKIRKSGISAIEVDLSKIERDITKEDMKAILESGIYSTWLFNKKKEKAEDDFREQVKQEHIIDEKKKEELVNKYGGIEKTYKIYRNGQLESQVIYNPPCQKFTSHIIDQNGKSVHVKKLGYCDQCPFFCRFIETIETGLNDRTYLVCKLKPSNKSRYYPYD